MELLEAKKKDKNHSEYLTHLENVMSQADFKNMTSDEMIIHVFIRNADSAMSKLGIKILTSDKPTVTELKSRIKETELGMQNKGYPDKTEQTTCKICKGKSHKTEECWLE